MLVGIFGKIDEFVTGWQKYGEMGGPRGVRAPSWGRGIFRFVEGNRARAVDG